MNEQELFRSRLAGIDDFALSKNSVLTETEIRQYFDGVDLTNEQWELVFSYLQSRKYTIAGRKETAQFILTPEGLESTGPSYDEDEVFLMYLEDLKQIPPAGEGEEESLYAPAAAGDGDAIRRLSELYLYTVMAIAKEYAKGSIPVGDLIQEGNLGLLTGLSLLGDKPADVSEGDYLVGSIRESIELFIVEQGDQTNIGAKVVDKVGSFHASVKKLEEEVGHRLSKAELSAFLNMPLEEIEEMIRLSGDELGL